MFIVRDIRCKYRTGEIVALMGSPKSQDYLLLCDGSTINSSLYPELVSVLGSNTLPNLISRFLEGSNTSGRYISAGLPNITGTIVQCPTFEYFKDGGQGSLKFTNYHRGKDADSLGRGTLWEDYYSWFGESNIRLDASDSDSIYGNSSTVQPRAMTVKYYICYAG